MNEKSNVACEQHTGCDDGTPGKVAFTQFSGPKQFNFARQWRPRIAPCLKDHAVVKALTIGLMLYDLDYKEGEPPWLCGRGPLNGQRAKPGCLSWYQPWGRCHFIAPFCWALGRKLYPHRQWGFISGDYHTVVIGWLDKWEDPEWVMDILLYRGRSAKESLDFAKSHTWRFYPTLGQYAASFCTDPECALEVFLNTCGDLERV